MISCYCQQCVISHSGSPVTMAMPFDHALLHCDYDVVIILLYYFYIAELYS